MPAGINPLSAFWFLLFGIGIALGFCFMRRVALRNTRTWMIVTIGIAVTAFLAGYLGWAFYNTSLEYSNAVMLSTRRAHTNVGREGYEYIFEPFTHVFIDRVLPNGKAIIFYVVQKRYLPSLSGVECTYPDPEICKWIRINSFFGHDQRTDPWMVGGAFALIALGVITMVKAIYLKNGVEEAS